MERRSNLFREMEDDANLQLDPWELPPYFLLMRHKSKLKKQKSLRTYSGYWKEKEDEFIAIRSGDESSSSCSPSYHGIRRTLEFYLKDGTRGGKGTKTDWLIHEYHHLRNDEAGEALFLEEDDVVLRKVFKKGETDQASSLCCQIEASVFIWRFRRNLREQMSCTTFIRRLRDQMSSLREQMSESTQPVKVPSTETSEGLNEDLGAHCHPDGKSDNVWKHFTKIGTNDPDVVYAACHHCDKVLKAHSKKHGISQLKRHRESVKCRSSCSNPSTDEDRKMLRRLRTALDLYKQQRIEAKLRCQEVNTNLTQLNPWDLVHSPWYVTTSLNRETNEGCWEEIDKEFTAIRMEQQQMQGLWMELGKEITTAIQSDYQMQMQAPQYMGLRRTLEFHLNENGNKLKTGWIMLEYQQVDDIESPAMFLQGDMVIRKVFRYDKDAVTAIFSDFDRKLNGDNDNQEYYNGEGVNMDSTLSSDYMHGGGDRKRKRSASSNSKRTSEVWMYFTEIRTADHDMVYAVCHHCDRGYSSGCSTNGTSHLWRHNKSCTSKPPGTGNENNGANAAWEAEIWPLLLLFKNYGETEQQS